MRIIAFDPSLVNLGYAYGHLIDGKLVVERVGTFQPDKFLKATNMFDTGDVTTDRQMAVEYFIKIALENFRPIAIVGETSFYNGCNPSTIINQSKGLGLIERVTREYLLKLNGPFELALYQPNVIKRTLGLDKEEFKDKTMIDKYLIRHANNGTIKYLNEESMPENQLDHGNDAVAMLYTLVTNILKIDLIE